MSPGVSYLFGASLNAYMFYKVFWCPHQPEQAGALSTLILILKRQRQGKDKSCVYICPAGEKGSEESNPGSSLLTHCLISVLHRRKCLVKMQHFVVTFYLSFSFFHLGSSRDRLCKEPLSHEYSLKLTTVKNNRRVGKRNSSHKSRWGFFLVFFFPPSSERFQLAGSFKNNKFLYLWGI